MAESAKIKCFGTKQFMQTVFLNHGLDRITWASLERIATRLSSEMESLVTRDYRHYETFFSLFLMINKLMKYSHLLHSLLSQALGQSPQDGPDL